MKATRIIDLSYPIKEDMLVYPGMERPMFQWLGKVNSEGYNLTKLSMVAHAGTHVDAPMHFFDNVRAIDDIPLEGLFGKAKLFRYDKPLEGQEITLDDLMTSGFEIEEDIIFILETGIERFEERSEYNALFPVPSEDLLDYLVQKKIKSYMTDATAIDPYGSKTSPKHHLVLGANIPIVENLRNLHLLPENKHFLICALPILLAGREGAPCRAVAVPALEGL